jgi:hypothetical protein
VALAESSGSAICFIGVCSHSCIDIHWIVHLHALSLSLSLPPFLASAAQSVSHRLCSHSGRRIVHSPNVRACTLQNRTRSVSLRIILAIQVLVLCRSMSSLTFIHWENRFFMIVVLYTSKVSNASPTHRFHLQSCPQNYQKIAKPHS